MINLFDYDYFLPESLIAKEPVSPRDHSKLLIYNTNTDRVSFDYFYNLDQYLPEKSFLMLNNTKVLPSRITLHKENGAKVVVLFLINEIKENGSGLFVDGLVDRKVSLQDKLFFEEKSSGLLVKQDKNIFTFKFDFGKGKLFSLLEKYGKMPLPLYIKKTPLSEEKLRQSYQTVFALNKGSAAAPTASLHFTDEVFGKLKQKNIDQYFATLHVGLGTFAPIDKQNIKEKKLHKEFYEIKKEVWDQVLALKSQGYQMVTAGTTVMRTMESVGLTGKLQGETSIFIYPPFDFQYADCLITNFHLPKTSLMLLVEAFLQHKKAKRSLIELYQIAIKNDFRFYSFGDAMLIL